MGNLTGKVVVVTGASSGIGQAVAKMAAEHGAKLVLATRREERLRELAGTNSSDWYSGNRCRAWNN